MRFFKVCILGSILFLSGCSIEEKNIEKLSINYWNKHVPSMVLYPDEVSKDIQLFIDAINKSEVLNNQVIITEPLLSVNMDMSDTEEKIIMYGC